jgi:hypothetical protein
VDSSCVLAQAHRLGIALDDPRRRLSLGLDEHHRPLLRQLVTRRVALLLDLLPRHAAQLLRFRADASSLLVEALGLGAERRPLALRRIARVGALPCRVLLCRGEHRLGIGAQPRGFVVGGTLEGGGIVAHPRRLIEKRVAPALGVGQQLRRLVVDLGEDLVAHAARLVDDGGALALRLGEQAPALLLDLGEHLGPDPLGDDPGLVYHPRGIGEQSVALGQGFVAYTRCVGIAPPGLDRFLARPAGLTRLTCPVVGFRAHPSRMTPGLARRLDARPAASPCDVR